jgi:hypothetical protein
MACKQKLSPAAKKAKAARDLAYAKTPARKDKKADAQRRRRKAGSAANGKDWDHASGKWESPSENRGNGGKGTKGESKKKYKVEAGPDGKKSSKGTKNKKRKRVFRKNK